jgi:hypothetical protein
MVPTGRVKVGLGGQSGGDDLPGARLTVSASNAVAHALQHFL